MADQQKTATSASDIEAQMKAVREDLAKLTKTVGEFAEYKASEAKKTVRAEGEKLYGRSREAAEAAADRARHAAGSVEDHIREKPIQSALIALLVGVVLGAFSRR